MPRISPWDARFQRPEPRTITVELPEMETSLQLVEASDDLRRGLIWDKVGRYVFDYVPREGAAPRKVLMSPAGAVPASEDLFQNVASVEVMQVAPEGELPFSMIEIVGIARNLPERWEEIKLAIAVLTRPAGKEASASGNPPAEGTTTEPSASS